MSYLGLLTDRLVVMNQVVGANDSWGKPAISFADAFECAASIQVRSSRDIVGPYLGADVVITNKIFVPAGTPVTEAKQVRAGRMNTNEVQIVTITGTPTGGTFVLAWGGNQTAPIAFDVLAAALEDALELLPGVGEGQVAVTGTNPAFTVTFTGTLAHSPQALVTLFLNSLTGGTSPSVATIEATEGHAAVPGPGYRVLVVNPNRGHHIELGALEIRTGETPGAPVTQQ